MSKLVCGPQNKRVMALIKKERTNEQMWRCSIGSTMLFSTRKRRLRVVFEQQSVIHHHPVEFVFGLFRIRKCLLMSTSATFQD
jgi:hypothetical protein